eukprot:2328484-Pleurochrysis_carterae.AAC.3
MCPMLRAPKAFLLRIYSPIRPILPPANFCVCFLNKRICASAKRLFAPSWPPQCAEKINQKRTWVEWPTLQQRPARGARIVLSACDGARALLVTVQVWASLGILGCRRTLRLQDNCTTPAGRCLQDNCQLSM